MGSLRYLIDLSTPGCECSGNPDTSFSDDVTGVSSEGLNVIAEQALRFTGAQGVAIALKEGDVFVCKASSGEIAPPVGTTVDKDSGLSGLCVRTGSVLTCDDAETDTRVSTGACRSLGIRSIAIVPIGQGAPVGLLEVFSCQPSAFDERAISLLRKMAELVVESPQTSGENAGSAGEAPNDEGSERRGRVKAFAAAAALAFVVLFVLAGVRFRERLAVPDPPRQPVPSAPARDAQPAESSGAVNGVEASPKVRATSASTAPKLPGNGEEQYQLATALAEGRGVKQDLVRAYALYVIAALKGNAAGDAAIKALTPRMSHSSISEVRFRLGQMFENGDHVRRDFVQAYFWFSVAEAAGHPRASEEKRRLENLMSSGDVVEARDRAARWLGQHSRG